MRKYSKPTLDTKFHVDLAWWDSQQVNFLTFLRGQACEACREKHASGETFDWIDPATGEVYQLDLLWHCIQTECSQSPDYLDARTPIATAVFRAFVLKDNQPMTPAEIHEVIQKKDPAMILRTIGGRQIYHGIRPIT